MLKFVLKKSPTTWNRETVSQNERFQVVIKVKDNRKKAGAE